MIERWFGRLKQFRRIATRYDKTQRSYRGFVALAACLLAFWILHTRGERYVAGYADALQAARGRVIPMRSRRSTRS